MRGCRPHAGLEDLRSPVSTRATTSKFRESGAAACSIAPTQPEICGQPIARGGRGACAVSAQLQRSSCLLQPGGARTSRNARTSRTARLRRRLAQVSGSGLQFWGGAARPGNGQAGSATGENGNLRQRKRSCSASEGGRTLVAANHRVPRQNH